ncbi:hypothetical protein SPRG_01853 [Saprolegnia parasitica CBS 223.65]|uniref:FYVE-type domain-containing protein n=1 Tax=Saprolegnia parasitica (strain CBS 223.65) TaxID=695850 RepID=A0A067CR91_SAPPC|nr:hypothetical protein SPRG_01853 [Saprolegnia parasitica CBS 223.65]KDO33038.1 hypothetical protein SPRG_01853 [Saprolegnia parasitica CBS 223.65]|eukprot:XP_012195809.1 hypothetical protein SPRG_01853 [Saprolegnia parasitica CBS 223.65]
MLRHASGANKFPDFRLSASQDAHFRGVASTLLQNAIVECEDTAKDIHGKWKYVREANGLKLYKAKKPSKTIPGNQLMATGIVRGNLLEVLRGLYAHDSVSFRVKSALLMPKEYLDCEVLHAMDVQDDAAPFRFNGLKWIATKWPGGSMSKSRDFCYFESMGIARNTDKNGNAFEYGYCFMDSCDVGQCPPLDAISLVRAKMSIRHIFREVSNGYTLVMTHCSIDACGKMSGFMSDMTTLPFLSSAARSSECAESARLSLATMGCDESASTRGSRRGTSMRNRECICCLASFAGGKRERAECSLCEFDACKTCVEDKKVVELLGTSIRATKKPYCKKCLSANRASLTSRRSLSSVSAVHSQRGLSCSYGSDHAMVNEAATVPEHGAVCPILDFDNEEEEESVYSGLDLDQTSSVASLHDESKDKVQVLYTGPLATGTTSFDGTEVGSMSRMRLYDSSQSFGGEDSPHVVPIQVVSSSAPSADLYEPRPMAYRDASPRSMAMKMMQLSMQARETHDIVRRNQEFALKI